MSLVLPVARALVAQVAKTITGIIGASANTFDVLNSSGVSFTCSRIVLNSSGTGFEVSGTVLNSSGSGFAVI